MEVIKIKNFRVKRKNFSLSIKKLNINSSQVIAICGPNGSGKSTFLSALAGLLSFSGEYFLFNTSFLNLDFNLKYKLLGYLPQETKQHLPFDVFYTVLTGRYPVLNKKRYSKEDLKETEKILKIFGLWELRNREFTELSGGEKKRVLLARIFNRNPKIVLLDEPFNQLDLYYQLQLINLFKNFRNLTVLAVIHDIQLAIRYFEKVAFLKNGNLVYFDSSKNISETLISELYNIPVKIVNPPEENSFYFYIVK